ncbi:MAG TPA: hypothetical protein VMV05_04300 [bacterium]|nr:hypothetical protein [bacterium]
MKNLKSFLAIVPLAGVCLMPLACSSSLTTTPSAGPTPTPTFTNTPCMVGGTPCTSTNTPTPTNTFTPSFTPTFTPTYTPTVNGTVTIPMGIWVAAAYTGSVIDMSYYGLSTPVTTVLTLITLSINHTAETTDTISLTTPSNGTLPVTYLQSYSLSGIPVAQYATTFQYAYVPNGTYSISVATSLGTVTSTMAAPGAISINSNGVTTTSSSGVTGSAVYPGNYDTAIVTCISCGGVTTFNSGVTSVGSPFTYPPSAYPGPASSIYSTTYSASTTIFSFTGPAAVGCAFVGNENYSTYFMK